VGKISKKAGISTAKARLAYDCLIKDRAVYRLESVKPIQLKQQVPQTIIKEVIRPVKVIKEVPVPVYKEITVLQEVIKEVEVIKTVTKKVPDEKAIADLNTKISKLQKDLSDANAKLKMKPKTITKEVIKEVVKEVPVEIIKEVEVVKSLDMASLQKMMAKLGTVQVSKKVVGESRTRGEGRIVSRKEIKPGTSKSKVVAKPTSITSKVETKKTTNSSASTTTTSSGKKKGDDLTKIEGIGPAIEKLLNGDKIYTFKELAESKISALQSILTKGGPKFQMHTPGSWPKQASMARDGRWDDLKKLQDVLSGGR